MREFRGKRVDNGEWVYGFYYCTRKGTGDALDIHIIVYDDGENSWRIEVIPETVGQYTGLKDKEGNYAYFGHIVEYLDESGKLQVGIIKQYEDSWGGYIHCIGGDDEGNQDGELDHTSFKIIGNIHDNLELL